MYKLASILVVALHVVSAAAGPVPQDAELTAPTTDESLVAFVRDGLPVVTLPYGKYKASSYDSVNDIYIFKNIRYAAPPVGNLRWAKPAAPAYNATTQDGSYGNACTQQLPSGAPGPPTSPQSEDCLFLDVYVPRSACFNPFLKLPVTVYTHGGAYIFGSKESAVGTGPIKAAANKMIFVSMNYRLGSFGFLAGTTMEKTGLPNAAFYDQRAAYQWVQNYISRFGGDPSKVTAMGESAGAGSILHHITAFGGSQDPLFKRVILLSIASEVFVDRRGQIEGFYQEFLAAAGCAGQTIACLRAAPFTALRDANTALVSNTPPAAFKPGPSADGAWIRQMPALELASNNYYKGLSSLILSHTSNEGFVFVAFGPPFNDAQFKSLTDFIIPAYAPTVRTAVADFFPAPGTAGQRYTDQNGRAVQWLDDSNFLCNYRYLNSAFKGRTYSMQYSVGNGFHADDLQAAFYTGSGAATSQLDNIFEGYQSQLGSLARFGSPNISRNTTGSPATIHWPLTTGWNDEQLSNVLNVGDTGFFIIQDSDALKSRCDFFLNVQAAITLKGGYVPPGGAVPNNLGVTNPNPSANYTTPEQ